MVDQSSELYNNIFKDFLKINNTEMYSTYNEGNSVVAERFIRTLKNKIFKHMIAISKKVYFDVLDDIINKYNNTVHKTITFENSNKKDWSEEVFVISKIKNTVPWTYVINDLNGEEITGSFYEKELQKTSQKEFIIEKVIRRKGDKLYVKWKGYDNGF